MLEHLSATAAKFGLKINYSKTKVMTHNVWASGPKTVQNGSQEVAILAEDEAEKYLG